MPESRALSSHKLQTAGIEGTLLMLDDTTPHVAVPVQAICNGEVIATTLSDESGRYQFINLEPGQYQVRCQVLDGYVYYRATDHALRFTLCDPDTTESAMEDYSGDTLDVPRGKTLRNIDFRFAPFKKGTWRHYGPFDGLAHDTVNRIYVEPEGVMWLGTNSGGISRYDGNQFVNFTAKDGLSSDIWAIYRDPDGVMWFGTAYGGVSRYDGKEFIAFTAEDGLAGNTVHAIHRDPDGVMWFGGWRGAGVSRYDGKQFVNLTEEDGLASDSIQAIHRDTDDVMWFGTGNGISRYDGKEFINFTTRDGLAGNFVWVIHRDPDGVMWFATDRGVSRYDSRDMGDFPHFTNHTMEDGLANNYVFTIHRDTDGAMWFGTWGGGMSRYDGKTFVNFTKEDGLPCNVVKDIYIDQDGVMWIGTGTIASDPPERGGLSRYDTKTFVSFTTKDGLPNDAVSDIHIASDGVMWIGTLGGVSRYDGERFINFTVEDGLAGNNVTTIESGSDGSLWFGTGGFFEIPPGSGVSRYDGEKFITFTTEDGLADDTIATIYCGPDGMVWFGTYSGISRYDGKEFANFTTGDRLAEAELAWAGNFVMAICHTRDGMLWFGTYSGAFRYNGKEFINYTQEDGLAGNAINEIWHDSDGILWFGTWGSGVSQYDGKRFTTFSTEDGLAENTVHSICRDSHGVLWFGTDSKGVSGYDGTAWTSLDTRDGLAGNKVNSICQDANDFLWFGTNGGLTRYRRSMTSPKVRIASVTTDQTYRLKTQDARCKTKETSLPAFTVGTRVTIEYHALDFKTIPEKRQYRCRIYETQDTRLRTQDEESKTGDSLESWVLCPESNEPYNSPTKETSFDWIPEKPGIFIFQVQAIDRDLNYSEPATLNLTIQPDPALVSMQAELNYLRSEVGRKYQFESIIGRSAAIMQVRGLMEKAIESRLAVLITGETGTGKELMAKAIHHNSPRKDRPLLAMNCGAIPRELLASELFGHRKGAFTGAREDKMGLFEAASGGTVILDEISEMPENAQVHLLRVLEERVVQRLGEHISRDVDVRVIAIANKDLMKEVSEGRFREDLYYRLSVFPIHVPPLRERIEDIPPLAEHFLQDVEKELDGFAPGVFETLQSYSWPGNVRELRNAVHRAAALAEERIQTYHFPPEITRGESLIQDAIASQSSYSETVNSFQRRFIEQVLRECEGNRHEAARRLKMDRANLLRLIKRLGISQ